MRASLAPTLFALCFAVAACAPARPAAVAPAPSMLTRAEWGAAPPVAPMHAHRIDRITIHHTATRQQPERSLAEKLRALQAFSQRDAPLADGRMKRAWPDVPYHYYVDHAGQVAEGRDVRFAGDTNTRYDPTGHLLIVLEGNFEEERPTAAQLATLERLVVDFVRQYGVPADRIEGHQDHADTLCPGTHLYALLPELRARVAGR